MNSFQIETSSLDERKAVLASLFQLGYTQGNTRTVEDATRGETSEDTYKFISINSETKGLNGHRTRLDGASMVDLVTFIRTHHNKAVKPFKIKLNDKIEAEIKGEEVVTSEGRFSFAKVLELAEAIKKYQAEAGK